MSNLTPGKPVVAVALNRPGGDVALRRVLAADLPVVAIVERGLAPPPGVLEAVEVPVNQARVGPAIRAAAGRDTVWVVVPRTMGTADYLISAGLRSVGKHVDDDHPGIAMLVVSADRDPEVGYRRALAMVDLAGRAASGMAALAAVELCLHSGASLDLLVLGVPEGAHPATTEEWADLLPVTRRHELFRRALALAQEHDLAITWTASANPDPVDAVSAQVAQGGYDVVIDAASGHRLRKRIGTRHDIRRLVDDHAHRRSAWHLLQHSTCDVLVVMDAISLGMLPPSAVRSGAAAAMALGMVSLATPAAAQASTQPESRAVSQLVSQYVSQLVSHPVSHPMSPAPLVQTTGKQGKKKSTTARSVTAEQVAAAQRRLLDAQTKATLAEQAVARAEQRVQAAKEEAGDARATTVVARDSAKPAAAELAEARRAMGEAEKERRAAEQRLEEAEARVNVVTSLFAADRVEQDVADAANAAAVALEASQEAQSVEAAAYEEYLVFAADVEAAEADLLAAADDVARAKADLRDRAEQAAEAEKRSQRLTARLQSLDEALAGQGLHAPALGGVTSPFGPRVHPVTGVHKLHTGTDFHGTDGSYYAAASGVVTYAGYDGAYGYMIKVDHGQIGGQQMETWYAHQPGLSVTVGQQVERGQVIGQIGSTGYSTGPHAHVELHVDGQAVDLMSHLH